MAQTESKLDMTKGISTGSTSKCQHCGGWLERLDGTDPDECDEIGGFREDYECSSCGEEGTYRFQYFCGKESYSGVCADYQ